MRPLPGMICAINRTREKQSKAGDSWLPYVFDGGKIPSVLSIAGSDSSGGAGIQADIKTIQAFGLYAQTAITALTAQNTTGVFGIQNVDPDFVGRQIDVVFEDIIPHAVKVGMVSSAGIVRAIADALRENDARNVVLDPVMVSTSGSSLIADETVRTLIDRLFPLADLLTPNIPEAEALCGMRIADEADMLHAARTVHGMMRPDAWVLVKGGHAKGNADDLLFGPDGEVWIRGERIQTENSHGTGCSLSSAVACGLACGLGMEQSVRRAKGFLTGALEHDPKMGKGNGPLDHMWRYRALFTGETADRIC